MEIINLFRRIAALFFVLLMIFSLCGCKNEAVENVEAAISNLGVMSLESCTELERVLNAYDFLSEEDKELVKNSDVLSAKTDEYIAAYNEYVNSINSKIDGIEESYQNLDIVNTLAQIDELMPLLDTLKEYPFPASLERNPDAVDPQEAIDLCENIRTQIKDICYPGTTLVAFEKYMLLMEIENGYPVNINGWAIDPSTGCYKYIYSFAMVTDALPALRAYEDYLKTVGTFNGKEATWDGIISEYTFEGKSVSVNYYFPTITILLDKSFNLS